MTRSPASRNSAAGSAASRGWLPWLPAVVFPVAIAVGVVVLPSQAGATVDLPDKTPEQVLQLVGESSVDALSGTLAQTSNLGLPELPADGTSETAGVSSALELLAGTHATRIYLDGPSKIRLQVLDDMAERDLIRNGSDVWLYDSDGNTATQVMVPDRHGDHGTVEAPGSDMVQTPAQLADRFLSAIDPTTEVTVGTDDSVAGREVYTLVLTPRTDETLIASVSVAVDAATGLPLRVAIQARGESEPAFQLGFTELSLEKPGDELFAFTPPPGATLEHLELPAHDRAGAADRPTMPHPVVSGSGWASVVGFPAGMVPDELAASPMLNQLGQAVDGGVLLSSSLVNVLLTDDGRLFAGAVAAERLQAAAAAGVR